MGNEFGHPEVSVAFIMRESFPLFTSDRLISKIYYRESSFQDLVIPIHLPLLAVGGIYWRTMGLILRLQHLIRLAVCFCYLLFHCFCASSKQDNICLHGLIMLFLTSFHWNRLLWSLTTLLRFWTSHQLKSYTWMMNKRYPGMLIWFELRSWFYWPFFLCILLQLLAFFRGRLLFVFNFHSAHSQEAFRIPVEDAGEYEVSHFQGSLMLLYFFKNKNVKSYFANI